MRPAAPPPRSEIVSLTSLRGVLAVWVVGYHFWNDALCLFPRLDLFTPLMARGHMAVPAFFMLSGFVLAYNYTDAFRTLTARGVRHFLLLRLARVYPVHLVCLLAVLAMVRVSDRVGYRLTDSGYSARDFVLNLFLVQTWVPDFRLNWNYPSWSISSEWFAYLFFPASAALASRTLTTRRRAAAFGVAMLAASALVTDFWRPWPYYELVLVVPTFLTGAAVEWSRRSGHPPAASPGPGPGRWRGLPEVLVIGVTLACYAPSPALGTAVILACFAAGIRSLALLRGGCHEVWLTRPVVLLGEVSYSLYMSHTLAQKVLYKLLPAGRFAESPIGVKVGIACAYLAAIGVACFVTYRVVEKPCRRALRSVARRPGSPAGAPAAAMARGAGGGYNSGTHQGGRSRDA